MVLNERISFERILCPIGLMPDSDEALSYAIALAKVFGAKLTVMHCTGAFAETRLIDRSHVEETLRDSIAKHLRLNDGETIDAKIVVVEGDPQVAITREAARRRIDLIVMCSRRRPFAAALLGSTAESICRTAPCPVLVTHPSEMEWAGATTNSIGLQRVRVVCGFASDSELALSYGLSFAQEYQSELHLIHVLPLRVRAEAPEIAYLPFGYEASFNETASRLNSAVPGEARLWCDIKQAVREGHPYREVLAYAEEQDIDLICMGASGTGFGMQALFGSNADRVLRQAQCPVLIARPLRPMIASPVAVSA
jgi:nucleotide-binding universal stress UspA family protein